MKVSRDTDLTPLFHPSHSALVPCSSTLCLNDHLDVTRGACLPQSLHQFHILKVLSIAPGAKKQRQKEAEERGRDCPAGELCPGTPVPQSSPRPQLDHSMEPSFRSFTCTRKRKPPVLQKRGETFSSRFQKIMEELERALEG